MSNATPSTAAMERAREVSAKEKDLTFSQVSEILRYEPETGKLFWLERRTNLFPSKSAAYSWNRRFAGKEAFATKRKGYRIGTIFYAGYFAHRIIWLLSTGSWPTHSIDHINGDRSDNRLQNLREATVSENQRNTVMRSDNTSGVNGVSWSRKKQKWVAMITVNRKQKYLGRFDSIEEAADVRQKAGLENGFSARHGKPR